MIEVYCSGLRPALFFYKVSALRLKPFESRRGYFIVIAALLRRFSQNGEWEIRLVCPIRHFSYQRHISTTVTIKSYGSHPRSFHFAPHLTTFDNKASMPFHHFSYQHYISTTLTIKSYGFHPKSFHFAPHLTTFDNKASMPFRHFSYQNYISTTLAAKPSAIYR